MAEVSAERALRAQLLDVRAQVAERDRAIVVLTGENTSLREQLAVVIERLAEVERRLGQNPRNSSQPPSSEGYTKPPPQSRRNRSSRRPGGQSGSPGSTLRQVAEADEVRVHRPARCTDCARSLRWAPLTSTEVRQVADLPPVALRWVEHRIEHRRCRCGTVTMASAADGVPAEVRAPVQYGPGVRAAATYLVAEHHLPLKRAAAVLSDLCAAPVAAGSVADWVERAAAGLGPFLDAVSTRLAASPVAHFDETGLRVDGSLAWVHSASTATETLYTVHAKRGRPAMDAAGVLPRFQGIAVHDCWKPYFGYEFEHALCNAHLCRELLGVWENTGQSWAAKLVTTLERLNTLVRQAKDAGHDRLEPHLLTGMHARYDAILTQGRASNPEPAGGWGRKRPIAVNLLDRLTLHRDDYLRFSVDFRVPFTNNTAEQDIRPVKIRQKISGCLRSMTGAEAFCRLRSYLSTGRKHHHNGLDLLRRLHQSQPWLLEPAPS